MPFDAVGDFHHVGVATRDIAAAVASYQRILGLGGATPAIDDEIHRVTIVFVRSANGVLVEFVAPLGTNSPVQRYVERSGGLYHICYRVADIDGAVAHARAEGAMIASPPQPAKAFDGRRVAFILMPDTTLVEFLEG